MSIRLNLVFFSLIFEKINIFYGCTGINKRNGLEFLFIFSILRQIEEKAIMFIQVTKTYNFDPCQTNRYLGIRKYQKF
jgi:hypothetical protein